MNLTIKTACFAIVIYGAFCQENWYKFSKQDVWHNRHRHPDKNQDGRIYFPDEFDITRYGGLKWKNNDDRPTKMFDFKSITTTEKIRDSAIPGMGTTRSPCENRCPATRQYDPVCGDNGITYTNMQWFKCALKCGRNVRIRYRGACPRTG